MDGRIKKYLDKALEMEEIGCIDEATVLYEKMLTAFPDYKEEVITEKAKLEFRNMREKEALLDFMRAYAVKRNEDIYQLVLEAYLNPNLKELQDRYHNNVNLMRQYPFYQNDFDAEEPDVFVLWIDEQTLVTVNTSEKQFATAPYPSWHKTERCEKACLMYNVLRLPAIMHYKEMTKIERQLLDRELPFYLVYDRTEWMLFAQMEDLDKVVGDVVKRVVILVGEKSFYVYLEDDKAFLPNYFVNLSESSSRYTDLLADIVARKNRELEEYLQSNQVYYKKNGNRILQNVQSQKPRILFLTSRFTTILQYHIRDCRQAAQRMGCETELLIEPDGIHRLSLLTYQKCISDFKPDIVFSIDHFRFEHPNTPENLVWIMWIQDPLPLITDKKTPAKLLDRDFMMLHQISWKEFDEYNYPKKCLIDAPIPANALIYRPYELSDAEWEKYACDICLVCHCSDTEEHIEKLTENVPSEWREMVRAIYEGYKFYVYESGKVFYEKEVFGQYIQGAMQQHFGKVIDETILNVLAKDMWMDFNQRVYRQALVDWLLDAGYTSIKLWGSGWQDHEKYRVYAMGTAQNGETLSKIYQSSKIVIGNNVMTTAAARAWETMLSGGFYLSNYLPPEHDAVDIRKIMKLDEEVAVFYDREDLLKKVDYYLHHEDERRRMIEIGRRAALERMTYDVLMHRVIAETGKRLAAADGHETDREEEK